MGHIPRPPNKESTKKVILMHEKIFKQQLHDLHRLYQTQKQLTKEMEEAEPHERISNILGLTYARSIHKQTRIHLERPAKEQTDDEAGDQRSQTETDDEIDMELTLGHGKRAPATHISDAGPSFSSSSAGSSITEKRDVRNSTAARETLGDDHKLGRNFRVDISMNFQEGKESYNNNGEILELEIANQPPRQLQ